MSRRERSGPHTAQAVQQALADLSALVEEGVLLLYRRRAREAEQAAHDESHGERGREASPQTMT